jgi:hypothetical protein
MRPNCFLGVLVLMALGCRGEQKIESATEPPTRPETPQVATKEAVTAESKDDGPSAKSYAAGGVVELGGINLTPPGDWQQKPPGSSFVAAEFSLPRAAGDDADGRLTISTAGGSIEANIDRWKAQFQPQPKAAKQEVIDINGLKVTVVDFSGDFNDQRGPFAPGEKRSGYRMIAAVIPNRGHLHFVKATGPEKTIESRADAIHQFIRSAKPTQ